MKKIIEKYNNWKKENPNVDYQYDEIHDFFSELTRGEMQDLMEYVSNQLK